jgi:NTE family protein
MRAISPTPKGLLVAGTIAVSFGTGFADASSAAETIIKDDAADELKVNTTHSGPADGLVLTSPADTYDIRAFEKRERPKGEKLKIGLALGGGGARGAAHVGALKVLEKEGIKFDIITGTSIGSVVGGLYAAGVSLAQMEDAFESGKLMRNFMTVPLTVRIAVAPVMFVPRLLGSKAYDGLYKGNKFRNYVKKDITVHQIDIEHLNVPFSAVSLNLLDGKPYMIQKGNLGYAMQASTAVPSLRKPVEIGDKLFVDGGVICNLPVKQAREMGADIVIAINIDHPFGERDKAAFRKVGSVAQWMLDWDLYSLDKAQAEIADVTIHPDTAGISLISRSKKDARKGVIAGEKAATELLPKIRETLQAYGVVLNKPKDAAAVTSSSAPSGAESKPAKESGDSNTATASTEPAKGASLGSPTTAPAAAMSETDGPAAKNAD